MTSADLDEALPLRALPSRSSSSSRITWVVGLVSACVVAAACTWLITWCWKLRSRRGPVRPPAEQPWLRPARVSSLQKHGQRRQSLEQASPAHRRQSLEVLAMARPDPSHATDALTAAAAAAAVAAAAVASTRRRTSAAEMGDIPGLGIKRPAAMHSRTSIDVAAAISAAERVAGMSRSAAASPHATDGAGAFCPAGSHRGRKSLECSSGSKPLGRHSLPAPSRTSFDSATQAGRRSSRDCSHASPTRRRGSLEAARSQGPSASCSRRASFDKSQPAPDPVDRVASRRAAMAAQWQRAYAEAGDVTAHSTPLPAVIMEEPSGSGSQKPSLEAQGLWQLEPA